MSDFCHVPSNADLIAGALVRKAYQATGEINHPLKRLLLGRGQYDLSDINKAQLIRMESFLREAADDARAILDAQRAPVQLLEAAE